MKKDYYLRIEAINLDYFVYDTHDISTIRGGSFMLLSIFDALFDNLKEKLKEKIEDIGSAASIGLYEIKNTTPENAKDIKSDALDFLNTNTGFHATFAAALVEIDKKMQFKQQMQHMVTEIRIQQMQTASFSFPEMVETKHHCSFDFVRPTKEPVQIPKFEGDKPSASVEFRKKYGVGVKNHIYPKLLGLGPETKLPVTSDLETLTANKTNTLDGMMAFIYMDGNRFGKIRDEKCTSTTLYKNYQNKIQDGLRKPALAKLLEFAQNPVNKSFRTNNESGEIRLETLLWGGDELEIIVPAWQAFNTVQILNDIFDSNEAKFEGVNLTHAGAVIFCKHNLPILQVRKYAHELCDEVAKFGIPKEIDEITTEHNRIAFFHISEFDLIKGDVKNFIKQHQFPASAENFCFTAADLPELFYSLSQLKIIPSSKVHAIVTALHAEKTELYERLFERLKKLLGDTATTELIVTLDSLNNAPEKWMVVSDLLKFYGEE